MSALEPGLYRATVRGEADVTVLVEAGGMGHHRAMAGGGTHSTGHYITDARPLIVLDTEFPLEIASVLRRHNFISTALQIESQTKPARIPEPGLWGVVFASTTTSTYRTSFIRRTALQPTGWARLGDGDIFAWNKLVDPTLIRDGIVS